MLMSEALPQDVDVGASTEDVAGYSVHPVASSVASSVWDLVLPFIERAREACPDYIACRELAPDILRKIEGRKYQLWLIHADGQIVAVSVTSVEKMSQGSVCVVQYQSGVDLDGWLDVFKDSITGWARENGCTQMQLVGRKGWERKLLSRGLKKAFTIYVAEL